MPLIVLTGYPCSGLSYRARQLADQLEAAQTDLFTAGILPPSKPRYNIHVVPTHDPSHPRTVYDHARTEKESRGVAYARAKRFLGTNSFVILDGMNYIKGYRYQLWCEAKALGTTCCVVHVGTPIDQCPSIHSRWDKPLFTVPWSDASPPIAEIWTALTGIPHPSTLNLSPTPAAEQEKPTALSSLVTSLSSTHLSPSSAASTTTTAAPSSLRSNRPKIRPHQATAMPAATDSSALYSMEKRTSAIVTAIRGFTLTNPSAEAALAQSDDGRGLTIPVPEASIPVFIPAHVATAGSTDELAAAGGILALPRLQRLRRQWIALNRAYVMGTHAASKGGGLSPEQVPDAFVRFLNAEFGAEEEV
ncbi:chromatin associated protein KTI12 [Aspergillus heteromorphus CBS 117.55]|uniref:Chromatin associated protein KTI12 n=1 Tax=Aspergillus heteromorphus CBS 117.55 TaxID=1448321 RepID=A0A317WM09_9EURO|nr:chromatin associated protein KTI12 [Aspergillus heteromorphus CBS 117.55]PWY87504.1 chromatin associated protein KTI12 [Aspergillus heteromorphus CBS 117.55]